MTLDFSREGPRPSTPGGPHGGPLKDPPANNNVGKLSAASALLFLGFFLFACTYTFGVAAPVPVPPSPPDAPSVASFYERRQQQHDNPRLLLLHDFPLESNVENDAIKMAREQYPALLAYIEDTAGIAVTALPLSADLRLFAFGESLFNFILILSTSDKHHMTEQTVNAIVEWFDGGGEESQGAEHEQHQPQQQQKHQLPRLTQEDMHQQLPPEQQQYYSPLEKSRSLLLLLGPAASPSLLQLAAALFGPAAVAPSFLQQRAADLFGAISFDRLTQQLQKQQQARGTVFAARELLEGHPHVVTPLAEDELLLYSGGYHLGALQVGCGARHCEKEPLPPYAFPLLLAPPTAFAVDGTSKSSNSSQSSYSSSSSSSRMTFASALQTRGNNRALLLSGPQACSGIFTTIDDISFAGYKFQVVNKRFCIEATAWALNRKGVLRWSNVKHHKVGGESSRLYTVGDLLRFSVDLHELKEGAWRPFEGHDVQVEYVLGDPLLRLFLQREGESPTFSAEFKAPDRAGILKFVVRHARLGYSSLLIHSLAPLRTPRTDTDYRLQASGGFYYFVAIAVFLGTAILALFLIYGGEPTMQRAKSA